MVKKNIYVQLIFSLVEPNQKTIFKHEVDFVNDKLCGTSVQVYYVLQQQDTEIQDKIQIVSHLIVKLLISAIFSLVYLKMKFISMLGLFIVSIIFE